MQNTFFSGELRQYFPSTQFVSFNRDFKEKPFNFHYFAFFFAFFNSFSFLEHLFSNFGNFIRINAYLHNIGTSIIY